MYTTASGPRVSYNGTEITPLSRHRRLERHPLRRVDAVQPHRAPRRDPKPSHRAPQRHPFARNLRERPKRILPRRPGLRVHVPRPQTRRVRVSPRHRFPTVVQRPHRPVRRRESRHQRIGILRVPVRRPSPSVIAFVVPSRARSPPILVAIVAPSRRPTVAWASLARRPFPELRRCTSSSRARRSFAPVCRPSSRRVTASRRGATDGCRYARAGHAARVRFTLMDLKFTEYAENDTRFIESLAQRARERRVSRPRRIIDHHTRPATARPSPRPAPASPSFADAR